MIVFLEYSISSIKRVNPCCHRYSYLHGQSHRLSWFWGKNKMADILQMTYSNWFSPKSSFYILILTQVCSRRCNSYQVHIGSWSMLTKIHNAICKADSRFTPSQWQMALPSNDVSHWLNASLESSLHIASLVHSQYTKVPLILDVWQ